ncbi:hypothetical protein BN1200_1070008 [Klebsiella variicola]|nr:hypothetical protein BN1200_1070008 [Klebsiella variicola]
MSFALPRKSELSFDNYWEPAYLTLAGPPFKVLRLRGISTTDAANAFAEEFMAGYNRRVVTHRTWFGRHSVPATTSSHPTQCGVH